MAKQMFDTSQNRLNYSELLQPELGYNLDFAVGLTYSLGLEALLGVPISMGLLMRWTLGARPRTPKLN